MVSRPVPGVLAPAAGHFFCKKQFAKEMFSGILKTLWYSTNRARLWTQPHKAF
jgi:hypothetical protein